MTNKEKYQQAFQVLQPSKDVRLEESVMKDYKKRRFKRIVATAAIICIALAAPGGAYAANVGGIQRAVQVWLYGDETDATLNIHDDGSYTMDYHDENGATQTRSGGGVAFDAFGNERAATEEEIMDQLNAPEVVYYDDGSIWFFYEGMALDITDRFDKDNVCYVKATGRDGDLYVTVKKYNGLAYSPKKYLSPASFNDAYADPDGVAYQSAAEKPAASEK